MAADVPIPTPPDSSATTVESSAEKIVNVRLESFPAKLLATRGWRLAIVPLFLALIVGASAFYFRDAIEQQLLLSRARRAAERGELETSEGTLEALMEKNAEHQGAQELLTQVSVELLKPILPLTFQARHEHRLGHCSGTLTLNDWGVEYRSKKHGVWRWRFDQLRDMERETQWSFSLETHEEEMLGLIKSKRYNFTQLSEPLKDEDWKRFRRLLK
jgi:hypothetical protein